MWSSMSGAEAIASLLSNPPLAQHLATYARMMAEPDALALLRTVSFGSAPLCALAQVRVSRHGLSTLWMPGGLLSTRCFTCAGPFCMNLSMTQYEMSWWRAWL